MGAGVPQIRKQISHSLPQIAADYRPDAALFQLGRKRFKT
ncbi:hypothetical protein HMPREF0201_04458 [Cedecea davisae DSM 4568]|uniref:Uncharacterized protein n=1 Tax=Cedecea davisae DSM 4568 TaxID=566551 RepID=S3IIF2_9ENTR|nr:hypothetical protein HMPREF0201_04458 [Cedecea davisae DSM 4568]